MRVDTAGWFCVFARLRPWRCLWTGQGITLIRHLPVARGHSHVVCVRVKVCITEYAPWEVFYAFFLMYNKFNVLISVCYFCNVCISLHLFYYKRLTQTTSSIQTHALWPSSCMTCIACSHVNTPAHIDRTVASDLVCQIHSGDIWSCVCVDFFKAVMQLMLLGNFSFM